MPSPTLDVWQQFDLAAPETRKDFIAFIFAGLLNRRRSLSAVSGRGRIGDLKRSWDQLGPGDRQRWVAEFVSAVPEFREIGRRALKIDPPAPS